MNPFTIFKDYIHDKPKIKKAIGLRVCFLTRFAIALARRVN